VYLGKLEQGKVIRRLRMERHLSIEDLAELVGEDPKFIRELEEEMYPDIEIGIIYYIGNAFGMRLSEIYAEIEKENIDYFNRSWTHRGSRFVVMTQRDKQRKIILQQKITHNFKNKHTKHPFKKKITAVDKRATTPTRAINEAYDTFYEERRN
jgi:transcriptional regulator with XRE-family HTH domain